MTSSSCLGSYLLPFNIMRTHFFLETKFSSGSLETKHRVHAYLLNQVSGS
jgi:hypothetical protein